MSLDRKEFLRTALSMVGLGFVVSRVASCGGSDAPPGGSGSAGTGASTGNECAQNPPTDTISANHGHELTVPQADVVAGTVQTYSIRGTATHDHMVTISPGNFANLRAGQTITITSTTSGHSHTVTISC